MYIQLNLEIETGGGNGDIGNSFISASQSLISFMRFERHDTGTKALSFIV